MNREPATGAIRSPKTSNPRPNPPWGESTIEETNAAVRKPCPLNTSARSGPGGRPAGEMLSRIPCCQGRRPVNIVT
jgi:hypothetical protein